MSTLTIDRRGHIRDYLVWWGYPIWERYGDTGYSVEKADRPTQPHEFGDLRECIQISYYSPKRGEEAIERAKSNLEMLGERFLPYGFHTSMNVSSRGNRPVLYVKVDIDSFPSPLGTLHSDSDIGALGRIGTVEEELRSIISKINEMAVAAVKHREWQLDPITQSNGSHRVRETAGPRDAYSAEVMRSIALLSQQDKS